jgi:hypothetical protein
LWVEAWSGFGPETPVISGVRPGNRYLGLAKENRPFARISARSDQETLDLGDDQLRLVEPGRCPASGVRRRRTFGLPSATERGLLLGYGRLSESRIEDAVGALSAVIMEAGAAR